MARRYPMIATVNSNENPVNFKRKTKTAKRRGAQDPNELLLGSGEELR